jgi:hypothetical protein
VLAQLSGGPVRRTQCGVAIATIGIGALAFLPPTLGMARGFDESSRIVQTIRARIEQDTAGLPDGSSIFVAHVPQWTIPPWYFGWGFLSALKLPFTTTDLANRSVVINPRNLALTRSKVEPPGRYDLRLDFRDVRLWKRSSSRLRAGTDAPRPGMH